MAEITLHGQRAVVTGASSGIGAATAKELAAAGASVLLTYHSSAEDAEAVADDARESGASAHVVRADISSPAELSGEKIRVNSVAPGAIKTDIHKDAWQDEEAERQLLKLIPYGRVGVPEDVAQAILWLASDASDYVAGTTLFVDGGMMLFPAFREGG